MNVPSPSPLADDAPKRTVALVLLSYTDDAPAGLERATASLRDGLRELGHRALIITASGKADGNDQDLITLPGVRVPDPATEDELLTALADTARVRADLTEVLIREHVDTVCWADASWGLGYLAPAPPGVATALKAAVLRTDPLFDQALAHRPDAVLVNSPYLLHAAGSVGYDTTRWAAIPNALLSRVQPPDLARREQLRRTGPVRIAARAEPHKGIAELIESLPAALDRPVEIALAPAGFEYWPGMQKEVIAQCRDAAARTFGRVRILPALPWRDVPGFFAGAAITVISTTSPETWCNTAAEALSAGTPVIGYDFGHVPVLTGPAGVMVAPARPGEPATALWDAALTLLADHGAYHHASAAAPLQVADHTPTATAQAFLNAVPRPHRLSPHHPTR